MNMNNSPTLQDLRALTAAADDLAGHHVLWVDDQGEVFLSVLPSQFSPNGFQDSKPSMRIRYETSDRGKGYVGPGAAADLQLMQREYDSLVREWADLKPGSGVQYVDRF